MILRIKKFAVIEDDSPDTVVNLVPVTDGIDNAATFGVSNEHNTDFRVANGQTYIDRANPEFQIAVLRPSSSDVTQLESWADNQTDVYISAITEDGGFFFGDKQTAVGTVKIRTNQTLSDNDVYVFGVTRETTPGFDPNTGFHQSGFWAGKNLIGGYEWGDADGDNVSDGWDLDADFVSNSFSSGQQTLEADTDAGTLAREIYFPFESEQVTFSINNDSRTGTYATEQIRITWIDDSDGTISSDVTTFSSTGRKSVTATAPAGTVRVSCRFDIEASSSTVTSVISDPALKLGTDATYSKF